VGIEVQSMANRLQDHVDRLDALFFSPIRVEMEKEAEIQAAAERRAQAIDRLQGANGLLQRKRRNYAAIRAQPGGGVGGKAERADAECKEAEKRVEETRVALEGITESLKGDMMRVMKERHYITARRLMEMVKAEATFSRGVSVVLLL
jgi:5-bromo-4-chloroindolyl phosphate hydrolysis protein